MPLSMRAIATAKASFSMRSVRVFLRTRALLETVWRVAKYETRGEYGEMASKSDYIRLK